MSCVQDVPRSLFFSVFHEKIRRWSLNHCLVNENFVTFTKNGLRSGPTHPVHSGFSPPFPLHVPPRLPLTDVGAPPYCAEAHSLVVGLSGTQLCVGKFGKHCTSCLFDNVFRLHDMIKSSALARCPGLMTERGAGVAKGG